MLSIPDTVPLSSTLSLKQRSRLRSQRDRVLALLIGNALCNWDRDRRIRTECVRALVRRI